MQWIKCETVEFDVIIGPASAVGAVVWFGWMVPIDFVEVVISTRQDLYVGIGTISHLRYAKMAGMTSLPLVAPQAVAVSSSLHSSSVLLLSQTFSLLYPTNHGATNPHGHQQILRLHHHHY